MRRMNRNKENTVQYFSHAIEASNCALCTKYMERHNGPAVPIMKIRNESFKVVNAKFGNKTAKPSAKLKNNTWGVSFASNFDF